MNTSTVKRNHTNKHQRKTFDDSINAEKFGKAIKKALLYSFPTALLISMSMSATLMLRGSTSQSGYLSDLVLCIVLSVLILAIPVTISIYKQYKYRGWIIGLALCSFLPFGTVLYLISLIWSIVISFKKES